MLQVLGILPVSPSPELYTFLPKNGEPEQAFAKQLLACLLSQSAWHCHCMSLMAYLSAILSAKESVSRACLMSSSPAMSTSGMPSSSIASCSSLSSLSEASSSDPPSNSSAGGVHIDRGRQFELWQKDHTQSLVWSMEASPITTLNSMTELKTTLHMLRDYQQKSWATSFSVALTDEVIGPPDPSARLPCASL